MPYRSLLALALGLTMAATATAEEVVRDGAAILEHPVGRLAVQYAGALHEQSMDEAMKLATRAAQRQRLALDAEERAESDAFVRRMVPRPATLADAIRAGSMLTIDGEAAYLHVFVTERQENDDGSISSSTTTINLPFAREDGVWRLAQ